MELRPVGLALGLIAICMILFGVLIIVTKKNTYYLPEGFTSKSIEYPIDPITEIQNPLVKLIKKLGNMTVYFANPKVWSDVYKTSQMSITDLARENIKKEKLATDKNTT